MLMINMTSTFVVYLTFCQDQIHSAYILQLHLHVHLILILAEKKRDVTLKGIIFFSGSTDEDSGVGNSPGSRSSTYNCHMCSKKFSRADILRKHIKTHVTSTCTTCGEIFGDKVTLSKHQMEVREFILFKKVGLKSKKLNNVHF